MVLSTDVHGESKSTDSDYTRSYSVEVSNLKLIENIYKKMLLVGVGQISTVHALSNCMLLTDKQHKISNFKFFNFLFKFFTERIEI